MTRLFFVAGTDTGVGKTLVTGALLLSARAHGLRSLGVKPVAAGCHWQEGRLVNADALSLQSLSSGRPDYDSVNPVALEPAIAPHIAAYRAGRPLAAAPLADHVAGLTGPDLDVLLVEGAGGWLVPLNDAETLADLPVRLGCPVILVVGMRLGCLNHALLTAAAVKAAGLPFAGWVANCLDPGMAALEDNVATLERRLPGLRLGTIPWLGPGPSVAQASTWLDGMPLWAGAQGAARP